MKKLRDENYQERWSISIGDWMIYLRNRRLKMKEKGHIKWMGIPVVKNPVDMWLYQEIIFSVKPEIIIEIGSRYGGTTLYFAHLLDIMGRGRVISIDLDRKSFRVKHPRITALTGSSHSPKVVEAARRLSKGKRVLIDHDANHRKEEVLRDLELYCGLVSPDSYFIVEDTMFDIFDPQDVPFGQPWPGPLAAIEEFLETHPEFIIDESAERYLITYCPRGFLRRRRVRFATVQGHKMLLDQRDSLSLSTRGVYEPLLTRAVKKIIKEGDVVLDLGAMIGYYTLIFAKLVGEKGRVFAFEPDPDNFELLKRNIEINNYRNVTLIPKAVSNKAGKTMLYRSMSNRAQNTIFDRGKHDKTTEVETIRLDDYFKDYPGKIDFIKCDCQGAEPVIIEGASSTLKKNPDVRMTMELWPSGLKIFGRKPQDFLKALLDHGFTMYDVDEWLGKVVPVNIPQLLKKYTPENKRWTNLFWRREPKKG